MDYVEISNSMIVYALCGITVVIALVQAILYIRMAKKMTVKAQIPKQIPKTAFRVGLISAIGPALGVFIVMVGLMTSIGGPMAWQRLSIIGAAPTELTAATLGAEAAGAELGGAGFTLKIMAVSWFVMVLNGAGWLIVTGLFTPALETLRDKMSGGDSKWLIVMSGACSLGIFGYLDVNEIGKGWGNAAAVAGGILGMAVLEKFVAPKIPKIREYNLGIAMIIGMACAVIYDMAVENKELLQEWKRKRIRIGTPTNLLAAVTAFIPVIWLCAKYDCWPDPKVVLAGWGMVVLSFGAFYIVEPISYYASLGLTGTYLSFLSGNIGNMRVPCATMALETTDSKPGTLQAEVASTMAICGSIITNLIATTAAVFIGSAVVSVLPDVIVSALTKYAAAAIFGGTFGTYALKYPKVAIFGMGLPLLLKFTIAPPAWVLIIVSVFGSLGFARLLYTKEKKAV